MYRNHPGDPVEESVSWTNTLKRAVRIQSRRLFPLATTFYQVLRISKIDGGLVFLSNTVSDAKGTRRTGMTKRDGLLLACSLQKSLPEHSLQGYVLYPSSSSPQFP